MYFALVLVCAVIFLYSILDCWKPKRYPPGPYWLPFLGCFPTVRKLRLKHGYNYLAIHELSQIYGPVMGLKLGNQKIVVVSTYDLVRKILLQDEFNGRPDGFFFRVRSFGKRKGILFSDGPLWMQSRRFTTKHLRSFGLNQMQMNDISILEAKELVKILQKQCKDGPIQMHTVFDIAVLNTLWCIFAGHRFEYDDIKLQEILDAVHEVFRLMDTMGGIVSQLPILRFIAPEMCGYNDLMRILKKFWGFFNDEITTHETELDKDKPRDLIDSFLIEMTARERISSTANPVFDRENLLILCLDLFLAGSKTTTDSLGSIFLFLAQHPEWYKVLQKELNQVIGHQCMPTLDDLSKLPTMEAFLSEVLRYLNLAPLGLPHRALKDVDFNGYRIPKDTIIMVNYLSVNNDEIHWDHPEEFRPQRFLDEKGHYQSPSANIPFSLGKRRCLGEPLARSNLFLFTAYIIHTFDIAVPPEHDLPDLKGYDGFTISPKSYYLNLTIRSDMETERK